MDFTHGDDRQMLADLLRRFLAERYPIDVRNAAAFAEAGFDRAIWAEIVELGIAGALFGPDAGGFGGGGFDIMVVFEELGRALSVEPFLGTLMAGTALVRGDHAAAAAIVAGKIAAFAHDEGEGPFAGIATTAQATDGGWRLDGRKAVVAQAEAAALIVVTAMTAAGPSSFVVDPAAPGVTLRGYGLIDGGRAADLTLDAVRLPADALVGAEGNAATIAAAIDAGLLALSAEALGAMDVACAATVDYLQTRTQFGQPIGRFQALQHRMADLLVEIAQARSAVINAAAVLDRPPEPARDRVLSAAKYTIGRVGTQVAEEAIQLHGGIGMTWELPLSHYAKRLTMIDHQLGDQDEHLQRYIGLGRRGAPPETAAPA